MKRLSSALFPLLAIVIAHPMASLAAEPVFVSPQPQSTPGRYMPGFGNEAIVRTRYTVKADGTVTDLEILGGLSNDFLNNMLRGYMAGWTFTPGTVNGEAADFYNQEFTFGLRVDPNAPPMPMAGPGAPGAGAGPGGRGGPGAPAAGGFGGGPGAPGAAPAFGGVPGANRAAMAPIPLAISPNVKAEMDRITAIVAEPDYDKALKELNKFLTRRTNEIRTVFDYSLLHELKSGILMTQKQTHEALEASQLATQYSVGPMGRRNYFLTPELLESALRKKFILAATVRHNALAWDTYETLNERLSIAADDKIHEQAAMVKSLLDSPEPLGLLAKITDKEWTYHPARRIFTVTNVDGRLNAIDVRCERRNLELDFQEGVDWTLPDSFGACALDFKGRKGTQFTVLEFSE